MKTMRHARIGKKEVDRWAREARLDLPDRWSDIRSQLPRASDRPEQPDRAPELRRRRRLVLAANGVLLAVVAGMLSWIAFRAGEPDRTFPAATYTTAAGTTASATATTTATAAATTEGTEANEKIYPAISTEGETVFYQPHSLLSEYPDWVIRKTNIDLQMEGNYQVVILAMDGDWNLLVRTSLVSGVGLKADPAVPTYEFGLFNLRDETYRRLFRLDAQSSRWPDSPAYYDVYTGQRQDTSSVWDGDLIVFADCITTQTIRTHSSLSIYSIATGETATYPLDGTLHESLAGDSVSVQQMEVRDGTVYFLGGSIP